MSLTSFIRKRTDVSGWPKPVLYAGGGMYHISGNTPLKLWEFPISKPNPVSVAKNDDWVFFYKVKSPQITVTRLTNKKKTPNKRLNIFACA